MIILQKRKKEEGIKDQNSGYTLGKIAELYLSDTKYKKRAINTDRYYRLILNNWILPELGDIKLRSIEESDLENLYDKMRRKINPTTNKPLSETYINHCHKLIKSIYNYAKKKKWILSNPADYVLEVPKGKSKEHDYYSYEEMMDVIAILDKAQLRLKVAIILLFNSGLRRGELIGLKWQDVIQKKIPTIINNRTVLDISNILKINKEVITIQKNWLKDKDFLSKYEILEVISNTLVAIKPKTDKSIRNIIIPNDVYKLLEQYKKYQINNGFNPKDSDYIFRSLNNINVWNPNDLTREWNYFIKVNKLKKITIHDIRHSHATHLLSLGIPTQDVARRLGHSEPTTTLRIYTHSNLMQDKLIVNKLSQSELVEDYLSFKQIFEILISDSVNPNNEELITSIEWLCNTNITINKLNKYLEISKNYILDNNPQLEDFINVIKKLDDNDKDTLITTFDNLYSNNLNINQIDDLTKYNYNVEI